MTSNSGSATVLVVLSMDHPFFGRLNFKSILMPKLDVESNLKNKTFPFSDKLVPIIAATEMATLKEEMYVIDITLPWDYNT